MRDKPEAFAKAARFISFRTLIHLWEWESVWATQLNLAGLLEVYRSICWCILREAWHKPFPKEEATTINLSLKIFIHLWDSKEWNHLQKPPATLHFCKFWSYTAPQRYTPVFWTTFGLSHYFPDPSEASLLCWIATCFVSLRSSSPLLHLQTV